MRLSPHPASGGPSIPGSPPRPPLPASNSRGRPGARLAFPRGDGAAPRRKNRRSPRMRSGGRSFHVLRGRHHPREFLAEVGEAMEMEVDRPERLSASRVLRARLQEPGGKIVLPDGGTAKGFKEMIVDTPIGHPQDGRGEFTRARDPLACIEYHGGGFLEEELVPGPHPRHHLSLI